MNAQLDQGLQAHKGDAVLRAVQSGRLMNVQISSLQYTYS